MGSEKDQADDKKCIVVGPWGGYGGASWDDGSYNGVRGITIVYGRCIDSFKVVYDKNGMPFPAVKHGGVGGAKTAEVNSPSFKQFCLHTRYTEPSPEPSTMKVATKIKLQFPDEYLTSVSGHYCPVVHGGSPVIRSLILKSNRRTFGPFGVEEGTPFSFPMEGGQIVGFKGRGGWYLDAIGFHICPVQTKVYPTTKPRFRILSSLSFAPRDGGQNRPKAAKSPA